MKFAVSILVLASLGFAAKQPTTGTIPKDSRIFVDSNNGLDTFILAALQAKHVPVQLVPSREKADFILDSEVFHDKEYTSGATSTRSSGVATSSSYNTSEAAFKLTAQNGDIVWAYATTKGMFSKGGGKQSVAEACAKHLKDIVK